LRNFGLPDDEVIVSSPSSQAAVELLLTEAKRGRTKHKTLATSTPDVTAILSALGPRTETQPVQQKDPPTDLEKIFHSFSTSPAKKAPPHQANHPQPASELGKILGSLPPPAPPQSAVAATMQPQQPTSAAPQVDLQAILRAIQQTQAQPQSQQQQ